MGVNHASIIIIGPGVIFLAPDFARANYSPVLELNEGSAKAVYTPGPSLYQILRAQYYFVNGSVIKV